MTMRESSRPDPLPDGSPVKPKPRVPVWIPLAILGSIAVFLAWRVLTLGLADLWIEADPYTALYWRPAHPEALLDAAEDAFSQHKVSEARDLARSALSAYPLDGRPYREMAMVADSLGDKAAARRLFGIALRRAPRDLPTRYKLLEYALKAGNLPETFHQLDMELRIDPAISADLVPGLVALSQDPAVLKPLSQLLVARPPWRLNFLDALAASNPDPQSVDRVFASRGGDDRLLPPRIGTEADLLVQRQVKDARWGNAYVTWVGTLSDAERTVLGNVYDGGFIFQPSGRGFAWQLPDGGTGYDVLIAPRTATMSDNVLQVKFDGLLLDYQPVKQRLILAPGHYRLTGMGESNAINSDTGLYWAVVCAEGKYQQLAISQPFTGNMDWDKFETEFDVPDSDCGSQWLRLDLGAGTFKGRSLEGSAIFDNLAIARLGTSVDPAAKGEVQATRAADKPKTPKTAAKRLQ